MTTVEHGVKVTVPPLNEYVPTLGTLRFVDTQFGTIAPDPQSRVDEGVRFTPVGVVSFDNKSTDCATPTIPVVMFDDATEGAGGVTVGVIVVLAN